MNQLSVISFFLPPPFSHLPIPPLPYSPIPHLPSPQLPLCNNYWQPEIRWVHIILCAFCQKNFFFAIKLHTKKIIVVGEID
ncbi:hypothetical protein VL20_285 [Microcystis panniformis FACHB-1757]|uniref:Uncharacterized protein n=1 Tax=Microcystis panniformis FACHB-1757 TaxID=1638788 RepID=A0A0K1RUX5_9CHRO|nr:hypothetical protein VL20_285 [Microcystis panniformis FACHB-1757]